MDELADPNEEFARGRRPAQWSLAEIGILIAGCAVAFSLPWLYEPGAKVWFVGGRADRGFVLAQTIFEALQKAALALLPLALWRRRRLAGVIPAGEFLLVVCAAPLLAEQADRLAWVRSSYHSQYHEASDSFRQTPGAPYWYAHCAAGVLFAASVLALCLARKRLPAWGRSVLLVIAYLALVPWVFDAFGEYVECYLAGFPGEPTAWAYVLAIAVELPLGLAPVVVGCAAVRDRIRREPATVLEWLGLVIGASALLLRLFVLVYLEVYNRASPRDVTVLALEYGLLAGVVVLAPLVVWWLGTAWRRWVEQDLALGPLEGAASK